MEFWPYYWVRLWRSQLTGYPVFQCWVQTCYKIWLHKNMIILKDSLKVSFVGPVLESGSGLCRQQNRESRCIPEVLPGHEEQAATSPVPGRRLTTQSHLRGKAKRGYWGKFHFKGAISTQLRPFQLNWMGQDLNWIEPEAKFCLITHRWVQRRIGSHSQNEGITFSLKQELNGCCCTAAKPDCTQRYVSSWQQSSGISAYPHLQWGGGGTNRYKLSVVTKLVSGGVLGPKPRSSWVQSLSRVWLFATPWTAARQASLSITNSQSLLKLMSIESVMPSNYLILCHPLLLLLSIFPSIRVFSNESALRIRWPKYWSFIFNISPSNEYWRLISLTS